MGAPVKTDTIVHERDSEGNIIRTEIVTAGSPLPDWASNVGDHVFEVVDDIEVTEPPAAPAAPADQSQVQDAGTPAADPNAGQPASGEGAPQVDPNTGLPIDGQPTA